MEGDVERESVRRHGQGDEGGAQEVRDIFVDGGSVKKKEVGAGRSEVRLWVVGCLISCCCSHTK